jgi:pimeloyl-ACP methyl ester carboxylesterase
MQAAKDLAGFEERLVDEKGVRMSYLVAGSGPSVVLIHGLGGAVSSWTELAPLLARTRRVIAPDLPGHGRSSPLAAAPNLNPFADRVAGVLEREGVEAATVVGHSFGGSVALRLAMRHPRLVSALVLAGAAGISSSRRAAVFGLRLSAFLKPARRIAPYRRRIARSPFLRARVFGGWGASDPAALSPRAAEAFLAGPERHSDTLSAVNALLREDPRTELHGVACPCVVVWGARDTMVDVEDAFEYARRLRAPLRVIADCGHLLVAERPEACLDAIESVGEPAVPPH